MRFDSKAGTLTTFGDVAVKLLKLMGQSGAVPGAILAPDIPAAVTRLRQRIGDEPQTRPQENAGDNDPPVNMSQRAFPLIELLERAAKMGADVIWEEERKRFST